MYGVIRRLQNSGVTVLLSTHIMTEVNDLCDRVLFLSKGRIMADASPEQLRMRAGDVVYQLQVPTSQKQSVITRLMMSLGRAPLFVRTTEWKLTCLLLVYPTRICLTRWG